MLRILGLALVALIVSASPSSARDLPVPADKGWQHAATGLILTAKLDGLPRTKLIDLTNSEHDVAAEFADPDTVATIYIFHPAIDDVAMWFERSEAALTNRASYGDVAPASADPIVLAPPNAKVASGLRRVYAPGRGGYRSTGLAMMPLNDWLIAVRISSAALTPAALDARMTAIIAALRWPANVADAPAVVAIPVCAKPLTFSSKAKRIQPNMADALISLAGQLKTTKTKAADVLPEVIPWCRDPASQIAFGVYRDTVRDTGYTIALQDAGRAVRVTASQDIGGNRVYAVSFADVDNTISSFPSYDRLPAPDRVVADLADPGSGTAPQVRITIDPSAQKK